MRRAPRANDGERFGAAYLIEILRGSESQRLIDRGHASLSVYGIGKAHRLDEWRDVARTLVHQGVVEETHDGYPVLLLNQQSWEVLRGQRSVQMAIRSRPSRGKQKKQKAKPADATDDALFQKLRAHRKQLADQAGVPPYVIFHDATLRAIAQRLPCARG